MESQFETFYQSYPRKVGRLAAERAFRKHVNGDFEALMASLERHKKLKQWKDRQYIPHPSTFLNQHRWEDEIQEADLAPEYQERLVWICDSCGDGITDSQMRAQGPYCDKCK